VAATLEPSDAATPIAVARRLAATIPTGGHLVVSSSMPIRNLEWFGGDTDHLTVHANRGANGIDGVVATAIGVASASGRPTTVLLGDIALIHDLSSVASLARIGLPVTLVVCDNDGGGIFEFLPQANQLRRPEFEALFGTPHGLDLSGVLAAFGLPTTTATSLGDVEAALRSPGPAAIVVRSRRSDDVDEHRRLQDAVREAVTRELTA
jgi:2-succinyl-5-enolpyruvyl-6-hydroxy-3-cyclohexene-1-carboxylate synthase